MNRMIKIIALSIILLFAFQHCDSEGSKTEGKLYYEAKENGSGNIQDNDSENSSVTGSRHNAITRAVGLCEGAIVGINVTEVRQVEYRDPFDYFFQDPFFNRFFGSRPRRVQEYKVQGLGSGFIISPDGYILTNHHVAGNATKVIVTMTDGKKYNAEIVGADLTSDVALLKIEGKNLPYLRLGNSENIIMGEWVIAFGNPFGLFDINAKPTVTVGVISNTGVNFTHSDGRVYRNMIQTDAAISSGNSGGPLVNSLGEVIGMNTVIFSTAQNQQGAGSIGIGFSIPINRIKSVIDNFKQHKIIDRNYYTGLDVREIDEQIVKYLKLKINDGVYVFGVERRSPCEEAGMQPGDVILEIDGNKILRIDDYNIIVNDCVTGQKLKFKILRDGKEIESEITLKAKRR
jgi:serine protease Do